jgi:hypothetical protein
MTDIFTPKNANIFSCKECVFKCCKRSDWDRHIVTRKHEILTDTDAKNAKNATSYLCECGKQYRHRQSLFNHRKKCNIYTQKTTKQTEVPNITPELIITLIQENKDMREMMLDIVKNVGNNNNNTTNSHNKTFNLQIFLNETCKDAMNIMDFVEQIVLNLNDLEETGRLGFAEGISKMILKRLKNLDVTQRPIHCSDLKRETLYIKDENKWEKEEESKPKLTKAVKQIAGKNIRQIKDWQKKHPDYNDPESKTSDKYMNMVMNVMAGGTEEEMQDNYDKVVKNIIKETTIAKEKYLV